MIPNCHAALQNNVKKACVTKRLDLQFRDFHVLNNIITIQVAYD